MQQAFARLLVQALHRLPQAADGGDEIVALGHHGLKLAIELGDLDLRAQIDRPDGVPVAQKLGVAGIGSLRWRQACRSRAQPVRPACPSVISSGDSSGRSALGRQDPQLPEFLERRLDRRLCPATRFAMFD